MAQNGKVLLINPVEEGDAGVYACSVEYNNILEETNDARLIINGPPKPVNFLVFFLLLIFKVNKRLITVIKNNIIIYIFLMLK